MTPLRIFRAIALLEGLSFVVLLFLAMPLKYLAGMPQAVRVVGSAHGLLFVLFVLALFHAATEQGWPARRWLQALVASLVPFGTFVFDRSLREEIAKTP